MTKASTLLQLVERMETAEQSGNTTIAQKNTLEEKRTSYVFHKKKERNDRCQPRKYYKLIKVISTPITNIQII